MLSPHRRHSKRPSDSSVTSTDAVRLGKEGPKASSGLFSYFAKARRRFAKSHRETDTLLPTTYANVATSQKRPSAAAITCNSFLMGGHYYPGKDKKRRHLRRRTLWYKFFCSSRGRKLASVLLIAYVVVWHVLLPLGDWLLQVGLSLSPAGKHKNRYASNWLQFDASLKIPDWTHEQKLSVELAAARARLQYGSPQRNAQRLSLLGNIVPKWYHRNDVPTEGQTMDDADYKKKKEPTKKTGGASTTKAKKVPQTKTEKPKEEKKASTRKDAKVSPETKAPLKSKKEDDVAVKNFVGKDAPDIASQSRVLQTSGEGLPVRTIHTFAEDASAHSKCQTKATAEFSTTLVTQSSLSRLWILNETCTRWKDPIVAVVFIPHGEDVNDARFSSIACPNLQIIQYMAGPEESELSNYPVNRLRNVGLNAVTTSHVMVMDVDFVPSMGLAETIREALKLRHEHHPDGEDQQALVVPAFERLPPHPCESETDCALYLQTNSSFVPSTFEALQTCMKTKDCIVFQSNNNWEGHSTTLSEQWLERKWYDDEEDKTTFMNIPCFHTARYEPYLVVRWCPSASSTDSKVPVAPYYDERFHGYGKNKIELVSHLRKKGYRFAILPEGFIVHNPHPESAIKQTWNDRKGSDLHSSMDELYSKFLEELETMYKEVHESSVKLCRREKQ